MVLPCFLPVLRTSHFALIQLSLLNLVNYTHLAQILIEYFIVIIIKFCKCTPHHHTKSLKNWATVFNS
jgi:hypothetical protein